MKLRTGDLPVPNLQREIRNAEHRNRRRAGHRPVRLLCPRCGDTIAVWGVLDAGHGLQDDGHPEGHPVNEKRCRDRFPRSANPRGIDIPMTTQLICKCGFERARGNDKISAAVVAAEAMGRPSISVNEI